MGDNLLVAAICVMANHLGLIDAIKEVTKIDIPIVGCVKCITFWAVIVYSACLGNLGLETVALAFLLAWAALWMDLLMGIVDKVYIVVYHKFYESTEEST